MGNPPPIEECVAALERLVRRHGTLSEDEAKAIGRLLTGNAAFDLPPAPAPPAPTSTDAPPS